MRKTADFHIVFNSGYFESAKIPLFVILALFTVLIALTALLVARALRKRGQSAGK